MAKSSDSQSSAADLPLKVSVERPLFSPPSPSSASSFAASMSSLISSSSSSSSSFSFSRSVKADVSLLQRSTSPKRVRRSSPPPVKSVNLSLDSSLSPSQSVSIRDQAIRRRKKPPKNTGKNPGKTCMCSPTTHPGSFRCHHHRNLSNQSQNQPISCPPIRLSLRRSAMTNSLVRIGTAEGDWVKRALSALVRPTLQQQRRRVDFKPRRSRLSIMSSAQESDEI